MLMLPLETQVVDRAILELFEHLQGIWLVREQVEPCLGVFNLTIVQSEAEPSKTA